MNWIVIVCSVVGACAGFIFGYISSTKKVKKNIQKQLEEVKNNLSVANENKEKGVNE